MYIKKLKFIDVTERKRSNDLSILKLYHSTCTSFYSCVWHCCWQ